MDLYGFEWICMDMDGHRNIWIYGYMDIWIYGCIYSMIGTNWGERAAALSPPDPPRPPLTRIFMRGQAPQTPHRFNGYTPPPPGFRG